MDLIYMNADKEDVGVMLDYTLDLAFGYDENDFECVITRDKHCCEKSFYLYIENTEYGGIIDNIGIDTEKDEVTYSGRTWHGILESKIIEPDSGADYLILSGELNSVLSALIERMGLTEIFKASSENSGLKASNYKMNRYIDGYSGIKKLLKTSGAKLVITFVDGFAVLSAKPSIDYSKDDQFDRDQISFIAIDRNNVLNHVICLGKGNLSEREVIHVYADENGNISETQVFTGISEISTVYENTNVEDSDELKQGGIDMIKEAWSSDELEFSFDENADSYDIGDIVGAKEYVTGMEVRHEISKKIVSIKNGTISISYPSGAESDSNGTSTGSLSGSSSENGCECVVVNVVEKNNINAVQSGAVYNHVEEKCGNIEILLGTI